MKKARLFYYPRSSACIRGFYFFHSQETILQQHQQGLDPMPGADLLALIHASRLVMYWHFINLMSKSDRFGGDLRAEVKPAALQVHLAKQLTWKELVAG